jgi:hypothetical protein
MDKKERANYYHLVKPKTPLCSWTFIDFIIRPIRNISMAENRGLIFRVMTSYGNGPSIISKVLTSFQLFDILHDGDISSATVICPTLDSSAVSLLWNIFSRSADRPPSFSNRAED